MNEYNNLLVSNNLLINLKFYDLNLLKVQK